MRQRLARLTITSNASTPEVRWGGLEGSCVGRGTTGIRLSHPPTSRHRQHSPYTSALGLDAESEWHGDCISSVEGSG